MADAKRNPTPAGKGRRSASPVPSRCVAPSLIPCREVASRYLRHPSPNGSKQTSSFPRERGRSLSPAARLKVSPTVAGIVEPAATKKTMLNIVPGICKVSAVTSREPKGKFHGGKPEIYPYLAKLGEDAIIRRSLAMEVAAEALEEAGATDSMVKNLSLFLDLAIASKTGDPLSTIDLFLAIYDGISSALNRSKLASRWVEVAMSTNLEVPSLASSTKITDPGASSSSKGNSNSLPTHTSNSMAMQWAKGYERKETSKLGMTLLFEMKTWFLQFVKDSFDTGGFKVFGGGKSPERGTTAVILQLKRVNVWLDGIGDHGCSKEIEKLKGKIFSFVVENVRMD